VVEGGYSTVVDCVLCVCLVLLFGMEKGKFR